MKAEIEQIIDQYISSNRSTRQQIIIQQSGGLMTDSYRSFAYSAATESVRQNSKELLIKGIYAIIIEDDRNDFRDNITSLTLLYHSGLLLGLDPEAEFKKVADETEGKGKDQLVSFIKRGPELKTLKCMGYKTKHEPTFEYVWDGFNKEYLTEDNYSEPTDKKLISGK
jgi:hypothetical protein